MTSEDLRPELDLTTLSNLVFRLEVLDQLSPNGYSPYVEENKAVLPADISFSLYTSIISTGIAPHLHAVLCLLLTAGMPSGWWCSL